MTGKGIPYRIDLCGGWLDQPEVSGAYPGPVVVVGVEADRDYGNRCGMATSSRLAATLLWGHSLPDRPSGMMAKLAFAVENPPGSEYISGSQDAIGITHPGVNALHYCPGKGGLVADYWPKWIERLGDNDTVDWLEEHIWLRKLEARPSEFDVLDGKLVSPMGAKRLAEAGHRCIRAIKEKDIKALGESVTEGFEAQVAMFPNMVTPEILHLVRNVKQHVYGVKITGAGGGGYLVLITANKNIDGAQPITLRRWAEGDK